MPTEKKKKKKKTCINSTSAPIRDPHGCLRSAVCLSVSKNEIELICKCIGGSSSKDQSQSPVTLSLLGIQSMQSCSRQISDVRNTSQITTTKIVNKIKCSSGCDHFLSWL